MEDTELDGLREKRKRQIARMLDGWSTQDHEEKGTKSYMKGFIYLYLRLLERVNISDHWRPYE